MDYDDDQSAAVTGIRRRKALWDEAVLSGETAGDYNHCVDPSMI